MSKKYGLGDIWEEIIRDIEDTAKQYSKVNRAISFGLSDKLRIEAANKVAKEKIVVDAGCGPGDMTIRIMENREDGYLICLDADYNLLKILLGRLSPIQLTNIDIITGLFEEMPLRDSSSDSVVTSFSLRDSIHLYKALEEIHRILKTDGRYIDIDIGKPDNKLVREIFNIFLRVITPLIASFYYGSIINPWKDLYKTIQGIPTNKELVKIMKRIFSQTVLSEKVFGSLIMIEASK